MHRPRRISLMAGADGPASTWSTTPAGLSPSSEGRRWGSHWLLAVAAVIATFGLLLGLRGVMSSGALFTGRVDIPSNAFVTAPDWVAPTASAAAIAPSGAVVSGFVGQGITYR